MYRSKRFLLFNYKAKVEFVQNELIFYCEIALISKHHNNSEGLAFTKWRLILLGKSGITLALNLLHPTWVAPLRHPCDLPWSGFLHVTLFITIDYGLSLEWKIVLQISRKLYSAVITRNCLKLSQFIMTKRFLSPMGIYFNELTSEMVFLDKTRN